MSFCDVPAECGRSIAAWATSGKMPKIPFAYLARSAGFNAATDRRRSFNGALTTRPFK